MLNCVQKLLASVAVRIFAARLEIGSTIAPTDELGPVVCPPENGKMGASDSPLADPQHRRTWWNCETQLES